MTGTLQRPLPDNTQHSQETSQRHLWFEPTCSPIELQQITKQDAGIFGFCGNLYPNFDIFLLEVELEAAISFKMSETFSTFAWYQNPSSKDVHVIKNNTKYFMLFIPCMLLHQYIDNTKQFVYFKQPILHSWVQRQMNTFCLPFIKIWWIHPYYSDIL